MTQFYPQRFSENLESFFDTKKCLMTEKISQSIEKLNHTEGGADDRSSKVENLTQCIKEIEGAASITKDHVQIQRVNDFEGKIISLRYLQDETREFFE